MRIVWCTWSGAISRRGSRAWRPRSTLGLGLLLGLAIAVGLAQALTQFVFDVQPRDPGVFAGILALLVVIGLVASIVPAWRATRVDPVEALRYE